MHFLCRNIQCNRCTDFLKHTHTHTHTHTRTYQTHRHMYSTVLISYFWVQVCLENALGRPLHDVFDVFCGTSIGSIIAMGLGPCKMPASKIAELFTGPIIEKIFLHKNWLESHLPVAIGPKYHGKGKTATLREVFGSATLKDVGEGKAVVAVGYDIENHRVHMHIYMYVSLSIPVYIPVS